MRKRATHYNEYGPVYDQFGYDQFGFSPFPDPRDVERQEREGVRALVQKPAKKADQIPQKEVTKYREVLLAMGFKLIGPTEGDSLFYDVEIPAGWSKQHDPQDGRTMFFVDATGNRRFLVWYKAASYDRDAYGYPLRRFEVNRRTFKDYTEVRVYVCDRKNPADPHRVIHITKTRKIEGIRQLEAAEAEEVKKAVAWAESKGLDLNNPLAHWDDADLPTQGQFPPYR